jgi:hypothetical protein
VVKMVAGHDLNHLLQVEAILKNGKEKTSKEKTSKEKTSKGKNGRAKKRA